ncbi:glycerol-3-phosphate dehydrogenase/oxidase [Rathayibacter toxicus]|uniref:FAD-dependent oxidoreductase n=1 Tax=Rathayibacter toxicus TaxID=145458 RepID=A0A0C5BC48_9MICO|nr:glycerol-3-phosphate dehydrogenase/oxidase [Rathayibacter toxicus]AJM78488.1 FAD-dependent oxidoreductase [Rathayibacter toxicus]ALS58331.1 FAD-dependent oxidoreductase [Rathayibacter toxicus]KKM47370.1 FAD-dependent oxidoreductase [Rathayibacter toxicus]PPG20955.1 glycerol-3-phosphate dehydrogenase/oxidase [Rathayibacter toxicus]PPG46057.1 glycerol-3-phosphate dehydrogenase/oxidase [Rathayibacter toxicus]
MAQSVGTSGSSSRESVAALRDNPRAKVLIIGGGINGIGTFRELAFNGIDVALVERGDYVSGASSASSHMIHGGIRYLENGEFRLVNEGVHERNGLLKIAPHYVKPLQTTIPIYSTFSGILAAPLRFLTHRSGKPQERGALLIKVGLILYDFFSRAGGTVPRHQFHGRKRSLAALPKLDPKITYTATYFDASVHEPERLALDVLRDALAGGTQARAANYVEAVGVDGENVVLRDRENGEEFTFHADVVVNVSGPWTDFTNAALGIQTRFMGGTKGSHIVLDNPELVEACEGREMFFEHSDGRIVLIYPLKGRVMVGTTDIDADPTKPAVCTEEEIDYFFELVNHIFPAIPVNRSQIVFTFSGIRPLPRHDDESPGFVSRDYRIEPSTLPGTRTRVLSLVGGKWTTFRALSEHLANEVFAAIGVTRRFSTVKRAIGGGKGFPRSDASRAQWISQHRSGLSSARAGQLLERYGTRARDVIQAVTDGRDEALEFDKDFSAGEIRYLVQHESVVHLIDLVLRRTNHAFTGGLSRELLEELAEHVGAVLGWDEEKRLAEVEATITHLKEYNRVDVGASSAEVSPPVPVL